MESSRLGKDKVVPVLK